MQDDRLHSLLQRQPELRARLALVGLFLDYVHVGRLADISAAAEAPEELRGLTEDHWLEVLKPAKIAGLLTVAGEEGFLINPNLNGRWHELFCEVYAQRTAGLYTAFLNVYLGRAHKFARLQALDLPHAQALLEHEELNYLRALHVACKTKRWEDSTEFLRTVGFMSRQRFVAEKWREVLQWLEEKLAMSLESPVKNPFWEELQEQRCSLARQQNNLKLERALLLQQKDYFEKLNDPARLADITTQLGDLAFNHENWEEAQTHYQAALQFLANNRNAPGYFGAACGLARLAQQQGKIAHAAELARDLAWLMHEAKDERREAEVWRLLGQTAQTLDRLDEADHAYRTALQLEKNLGNEAGAAQTLDLLGKLAQQWNRFEDAFSWFESSRRIWHELRRRNEETRTLLNLGTLETARKNFPAAAKCYQRSLELAVKIHDSHAQATALLKIGQISLEQNAIDLAAERFEEALKLAEALWDTSLIAAAFHCLGNAAYDRNHFAKADEHYRKSLFYWQSLDRKKELAQVLYNLGLTAEATKQPEQARIRYQQCYALETIQAIRPTQIAAQKRLARLALNCRDWLEVIKWCDQVLESLEVNGNPRDRGEIYSLYAQMAIERGDIEKARRYCDQSYELLADQADLDATLELLDHYRRLPDYSVETAIARYQHCLAQATSTNNHSAIFRILKILSSLAGLQGRWEEAEAQLRKALALADAADNVRSRVATLDALGNILEELGRFDEAAEAYGLIDHLGTRQNLDYIELSVMVRFGDKALARGAYDDALIWFQRAWKRLEGDREKLFKGNVARGLGEVAFRQGDYENAAHWFVQSRGLFGFRQLNPHYVQCLLATAELHEQLEQWWRAGRAYRKALKVSETIHKEPLIAHALVRLAAFAERRDARAKAVRYYRRAEPLLEKFKDKNTLIKVREALQRLQPG